MGKTNPAEASNISHLVRKKPTVLSTRPAGPAGLVSSSSNIKDSFATPATDKLEARLTGSSSFGLPDSTVKESNSKLEARLTGSSSFGLPDSPVKASKRPVEGEDSVDSKR